ncbi:MAG: winged helix DNA-binding protein [Thaumarchaeota archaeon]|nr:winged helix DNA-binding protein [Nitrososphaerota archaeon]
MELKGLNRWGLLLLSVIVLLTLSPLTVAAGSDSLTLRVYSDGYVNVTQVVASSSKATTVVLPLLSSVVSNLVATDQNGSPLSYGFPSGGSNLTVYTLGATMVNLRYDTNGLTSKNGTVWTLAFMTQYNSTVILPQLSTLSSVSGSPNGSPDSINETNQSPVLTLTRGTWRISYGVSLGSATSTSTGGGTPGGPAGSYLVFLEEAGAIVLAVAVGGVLFRWWRRRGLGPISGELRPDDVQVLNFIQEKGGKVLEPEIRTRFALPKTSAWRQIKRLERLGYVKVTKIGSQNRIEILRQRDTGA